MARATNTKQIAVFKTRKGLLEFMDDTKYTSEAMAWPHTYVSRIRINAKDYSKGVGDLAIDAFYNLSPDEFGKLKRSILRAKSLTINEYNHSKGHLNDLMKLKKCIQPEFNSVGLDQIRDLAEQFFASPNIMFHEAGEKLLESLKLVGYVKASTDSEVTVDSLITRVNAEVEGIKNGRVKFSDIKILNYDKYTNPDNEKERRVTLLKVVYNPTLNYSYQFTVANGWGEPVITKQKGVLIKEGSTRFTQTVNISIDEDNLLSMLERIESFIQAMTAHGLRRYFNTVSDPILFHEPNSESDE